MACILRDSTNEQSWLAKDIDPRYVDAFIYLMKGDWEKALSLVSYIKYTPPDPINCRCMVIANRAIFEGEAITSDMIKE